MKSNGVPLVLAVTGHRDVLPKDKERLFFEVTRVIQELTQRLPATPIVLLSALAEGADMIAAEAAIEENIQLHAVLPYEKKKYITSFEEKGSINIFNDLYEKSSRKYTLQCPSSDKIDCYQHLGEYLADHCNILIALWDGEPSSKRGGTSWVVDYKMQQVETRQSSLRKKSAIYHIKTPRLSNPNVDCPFSVKKTYPGTMDKTKFFASFLLFADIS